MCHDDSSSPPAAPGAVAAASAGELELVAHDGTRFAAYGARATRGSGHGVVVMPDARGLHPFYRQLAVRFAEVGVDAVAMDYFGRTAGIGERSEAFDYQSHLRQTTPTGITADVHAAMEYLRGADGGAATSVFTVGFCFGGGNSWRQSADTPGLAGSIGFYGRPEIAADVVDRMRAPLLMLVAGADQHINPADVEHLAGRVRSAGGEAEVVVYDGAPHSFFDRSFDQYAADCDDAWRRVREFIGTHR